ncbi:MAG: hypothetical protein COU29_02965 [Candidatus Magasanikbacteria bacterium CG10_big_fil_rev_8_21_14_0_10_36_32]|uniref:Uncharacterized protein n=1 Tax=Candidatus Magasanikbacteria bacterium CG10_big_fil_rev_8_21_14_0_10_36_32 TaxID=1974646 RepID=A0A2M6W5X9_9BACT|nr:MAG: hypothetical protein COU29_02965 [Candidatus Magasanikbacteria bacterium CG10_big_fil_rev_8_21_14_0_10_36_32]
MKNIEGYNDFKNIEDKDLAGVDLQNEWGLMETKNYIQKNLKFDYSNRNGILEYLLSRNELDKEKIIKIIDYVGQQKNQNKNLENIVSQLVLEGSDDVTIFKKLVGKSTDELGLVTVSKLMKLIKKFKI